MQQKTAKKYTVAILGVGARGGNVYGRLIKQFPERFEIVSLCDARQERLTAFGAEFGVKESLRFTDEKEFFQEKRADLLVIATQDKDHVRHCLKAFETGYDILMEKPITDKKDECRQVLEAQEKYGRKALICHVLRYAPAFLKVAELLDSGAIGRLVAINALERVTYWHQAHSYVRGNWRSDKEVAPMILAKCCHDLDLIQYYARSKATSVSSVGDLTFFKTENAPPDAAKRCLECPHAETCPYSAKVLYIDRFKKVYCPEDYWPYNVVTPAPVTVDSLTEALRTGPYGRCVFHCDNNVVDHQLTQIAFANGVKACLTMTAFTTDDKSELYGLGRRMSFHGTYGEILLDELEDSVTLMRFGEEKQVFKINALGDNGYGHGGGDYYLIKELCNMLDGVSTNATSLEASIESHLIGICAEESRLQGGERILVHE